MIVDATGMYYTYSAKGPCNKNLYFANYEICIPKSYWLSKYICLMVECDEEEHDSNYGQINVIAEVTMILMMLATTMTMMVVNTMREKQKKQKTMNKNNQHDCDHDEHLRPLRSHPSNTLTTKMRTPYCSM